MIDEEPVLAGVLRSLGVFVPFDALDEELVLMSAHCTRDGEVSCCCQIQALGYADAVSCAVRVG